MSNIWVNSDSNYHVYRSTNEGVDWTDKGLFSIGDPHSIVVLDDGNIIVVGGDQYIKRSVNGGSTWNIVLDLASSSSTVRRLIKSRGFDKIFGTGGKYIPTETKPYFFYSENQGFTWTEILVEDISPQYGTSCTFLDDDETGWLCTPSRIYKTIDGGDTWTLKKSTGLSNLYDIYAYDVDNIWCPSSTAAQGIWKSTDGGDTWTAYLHPGAYGFRSVYATDADHVWALGGSGVTMQVGYSTDGGETWLVVTETDDAAGATIQSGRIHFVNSLTGYAGFYNLWKSTNGGQAWVKQGNMGSTMYGMYFDVDLSVQFREFDITQTEPTDRTSDGNVASTIAFPTQDAGDDSAVKCIIFRATNLGMFSTITNMKFYLQNKTAFVGTNSYYCDITDTWTQSKTVSQVSGGTPGTIPESLPESANVTKIGGGDITGVEHADTSQYIYLAFNIGLDETSGSKELTYRMTFDYS